ncbi:hypothetical protein [Rhodoferax sp. TS-BS-61-7]|uniref:hypothetical protein n=1 Tax=Rhodoferax sp. TS-BS-61-7 TaxID=2094194 RepID=UPI000CF630C2|nr:hypothetical protein [Rhodoferax sp. TS-BS-61-7]PQA78072.1 hypothetical protein C5F53_06980 [Rhodoferax sp. TS-BS-61-7]
MTERIHTNEPVVALTDWSVYEVPLFGPENLWTRHFVGYAEDLDLPQVSSAIGTFDPSTGIGTAASGRVFQLVGQSGRHLESSRMWVRWKRLNQIHEERDITFGMSKYLGFFNDGGSV